MLTDFRDRFTSKLESARGDAMVRLIAARGEDVPLTQGYIRGVQQALDAFVDLFDEFTNIEEDA